MGRSNFEGDKGAANVNYRYSLPWALQQWTDQDGVWEVDSGGPEEVRSGYGCTLAPPGEYKWTVRVQRRCGIMSNYFDHSFHFYSALSFFTSFLKSSDWAVQPVGTAAEWLLTSFTQRLHVAVSVVGTSSWLSLSTMRTCQRTRCWRSTWWTWRGRTSPELISHAVCLYSLYQAQSVRWWPV